MIYENKGQIEDSVLIDVCGRRKKDLKIFLMQDIPFLAF